MDPALLKAIAKLLDTKLDEQTRTIKKEFNDSIEHLSDQIKDLQKENLDLQKRCADIENENGLIKSEVLLLKAEVKAARQFTIRQEQYSRKNNVKIYGMTISDRETPQQCKKLAMDMFKDDLNIIIQPSDILESHPLPRGKKSSMIVKFKNYSTKCDILRARKALKGSGVSIAEDISGDIQLQIKEIESHPQVDSVFVWFQKIYVKDNAGQYHKFSCGQPTPLVWQC